MLITNKELGPDQDRVLQAHFPWPLPAKLVQKTKSTCLFICRIAPIVGNSTTGMKLWVSIIS